MKSYRLSHQNTVKADRYQNTVYREGSYDDFVWQAEKEILEKEVTGMNGVRYLDFACGTGRIISHLEHRVGLSIGVDNSRDMLRIARERVSKSKLIETDITINDALEGEQFDLITAFRFFLNAEPQLRDDTLRVLVPKLARDGVFIFNIHGNTASYRLATVLWYKIFGRRLNHLSYRTVKRLLKRHGIRIERMYGFGVLPKPLYHLLPKSILFAIDRAFSKVPFVKYISCNLIFVCKHI